MKVIKEDRKNGVFLVEGQTGQNYEVRLNPFECQCPAFQYNNIKTGEFCKHINLVLQHLEK